MVETAPNLAQFQTRKEGLVLRRDILNTEIELLKARHALDETNTADAEAQVVNSSVIATCKNRFPSAITFISQAVCGVVGSLFTTATKG